MREDVEFDAEGTLLRGWFYQASNDGRPAPVIVMAHGYAGVKEQLLDRYAKSFQAAGLGVLVYDHRNFGASEGSPRQEVDPVLQVRDYRHAITYTQTRSDVDGTQIGIWGSSYSGGHVLVVAAVDRRVKAVVSQVPTISGYTAALRRVAQENVPALIAAFDADRAARFAGKPPATVPMVSLEAAENSAYSSSDTDEFLRITRPLAPSWKNEVTLRSIEMSREYEPGIYISRISPTPLLMVIADRDNVVPADLAFEAYERALQPKELLIVKGGHYVAYMEEFERTATRASEFFAEHLGVVTA